jgi:hypothetical protein
MRSLAVALAAVALLACSKDPTAPIIPGDDPSAILGHYSIKSVNSLTAFPAILSTTDSLTVELGDATLDLFADGSYLTNQYVYEIRSTSTESLPRPGSGHFALHGSTIQFQSTTGVPPAAATVVGSDIRAVQSVRDGRAADTLVFKVRTVLLGGSAAR